MAIKVNSHTVIHDSRKGNFQTLNVGVNTTESLPSTPEVGDIAYDSTEEKLVAWTGTEWA